MTELCHENALSQTEVVCGEKGGKWMCISAQKLLQRSESESNPGWNHLIATM